MALKVHSRMKGLSTENRTGEKSDHSLGRGALPHEKKKKKRRFEIKIAASLVAP